MMKLKGKNILVLGLGVSGISTAKALDKLGANVVINDKKNEKELKECIKALEGCNIKYILGTNDVVLDNIDFVIKSPGIPMDLPLIKKAEKKGIEVVTDIELAYRLCKNNFIAITGTNGKTTTTTLTGEIFKNSGAKCHVVGNIGVGILWEVVNSYKDDIFVIEASSFQLEGTKTFKPKVAAILNITPDHLNWHKTFDNYVEAKKKIFRNQNSDDYLILNYDDEILNNIKKETKSKIIYFSTENTLNRGIVIEDNNIVIKTKDKKFKIISIEDIPIPGKHNLENIMTSIGIAWTMGISVNVIANTIRNFRGVEHRLEYVTELNGIKFYNDSKGTNPNASQKAVEALNGPIILIAGGMDKGNDFTDFIKSFNNKVKAMVLLGETSEKIMKTAIKEGFCNIYIVENMEIAVNKAYSLASKGDKILLSPACASWDMYKNFEERGRDYKQAVVKLRED